MKPGDLVRIRFEEFESKNHPLYGAPGVIVGIPKGSISNIPEEFRLWEVLMNGEITRVQGVDLEILDEAG